MKTKTNNTNSIDNMRTKGEYKMHHEREEQKITIYVERHGAICQIPHNGKLVDEHEANAKYICKAVNNFDKVVEALKDVLASWDKNMGGDIEIFKESELGNYWSPAQAMVRSETINKVRLLIESLEKPIANKGIQYK